MSSKLVRKGLDLVNSEGSPRSQKRKLVPKEKQPSKKRKQSSYRADKEKQQPRGLTASLSSSVHRKRAPVDFTEQNLEYFKTATWKIKKETYDKILERQNKLQKNNKSDEKLEESENEGGLFDD